MSTKNDWHHPRKNMPHIVYKHGDEYRMYTPTMVLTTGPRKSISANLMYMPFTGTEWKTMYVVHDGPYYFSDSVLINDGRRSIGDGHVKTAADRFIVNGSADPDDLTILLMPQEQLYDYLVSAVSTKEYIIISPCGTITIVAPNFFVSSAGEIQIKECPVALQAMYLGIETFEKVAARMLKNDAGILRSSI